MTEKEENEMIKGLGGFTKQDVTYIVNYVMTASKHLYQDSRLTKEDLINEAITNIQKGLGQ